MSIREWCEKSHCNKTDASRRLCEDIMFAFTYHNPVSIKLRAHATTFTYRFLCSMHDTRAQWNLSAARIGNRLCAWINIKERDGPSMRNELCHLCVIKTKEKPAFTLHKLVTHFHSTRKNDLAHHPKDCITSRPADWHSRMQILSSGTCSIY